jgi:16S rRNA (uracil1498-N3)-methyltransferase
MAVHDFTSQRLFVDAPLQAGAKIAVADEQANYLLNVLRMAEGAEILIFNGRDGEWRASIAAVKKRSCMLEVSELVRAQLGGPDIDYLFAPLKRSRLDYMVQKAVELGVARLRPVITHRTIAERVNLDRMRANVIEAAEQCGVLRVPETLEPRKLEQVIAGWDATRRLVLADEEAEVASPLAVLNALPPGPLAVIIGPEGGFDAAERELLVSKPYVVRVSLGPRIMRADTAAVAILSLVNAVLGDWR